MSTILLIDSDKNCCDSIEMIFREEGSEFSVLKAYDGIEGISLAREHSVDLIILSLFMHASMKGDQILREVKFLHPCVKVVFNTGYDLRGPWNWQFERETIARIQELGYDAYLIKPPEPIELIRIVTDILHGKAVS